MDPPILEVTFSPEVEEKLFFDHRLTQWQVQQVVFDPASVARWDLSDQHGGRVIVRGYTAEAVQRPVYVALRLVDPARGEWACITAFVPTDEDYGLEGDHDE
jgi:hypothetical protein